MITAMGFMSMGENAAKIGSITITPDLLSELLKKPVEMRWPDGSIQENSSGYEANSVAGTD